jgi:leucyl aminopeptidase
MPEGIPWVLFVTKEGKEGVSYSSLLPDQCAKMLEDARSVGRPYCEGKMTFLIAKPSPLVIYGMGCKPITLDRIRSASSRVGRELMARHIDEACFVIPPLEGLEPKEALEEACAGLGLGVFDLGLFKTTGCSLEGEEHETPRFKKANITSLAIEAEKGREILSKVQGLIESVNWARRLNTLPGNMATPEALAKEAKALGEMYPEWLQVEVLGKEEIEKERMGGVLAVAAGSENSPRFIVLEYKPEKFTKTIAMVGKAVTFDSGGISLKPAKDMDKMKYDKSGGIAVLGIIRALCELKLPIGVVGIIPAVENMPSGQASRPGDVITLRAGRTIEIVNTDAEGRLILADGLDYALTKNPDLIVDLATLTGACVIALGHLASGLLGTADSKTIEAFSQAGERTGERVWQLPLWEGYQEALKTPYADFKNVGDGTAGTITAASFLKPYVKDKPWVHLDIAGTAWNEKEGSFLPVGPTGTPIRMLLAFLEAYSLGA